MDMNETLDEEKDNLRKYLLHELAEAEQEQIEIRLLRDRGFGRSLEIAQDELIDDFVNASLSDHEKDRFQKHYLITSERQRKLGFATALDKYVTDSGGARKAAAFEKLLTFVYAKPFNAAFAAVGLFLIFGAGLLTVWRIQHAGYRDRQQEFARVNRRAETDSISYSQLRQDSEKTRVLSLRQNVVREDGDSRKVEINAGVTLVRLLLEVETGSYQSFNGTLQTARGDDLASVENLSARDVDGTQFVVINVPAELLTSGDYQLRLTGTRNDGQATDIGLYPFQVVIR